MRRGAAQLWYECGMSQDDRTAMKYPSWALNTQWVQRSHQSNLRGLAILSSESLCTKPLQIVHRSLAGARVAHADVSSAKPNMLNYVSSQTCRNPNTSPTGRYNDPRVSRPAYFVECFLSIPASQVDPCFSLPRPGNIPMLRRGRRKEEPIPIDCPSG